MDTSLVFHAAAAALRGVLSPDRFVYMLVGVLIAMPLAILPGMGGINTLAILLPVILTMSRYHALAIMTAVVAVTHVGDSVTAILLGIPGTAAAQALVLDGHALARQGAAGRAFSAAMVSSLAGGLVGGVCLFLIAPIARPIILAIGTPELFMLTVMGLCTVALLSGRNLSRGISCACFGLLLAMVGYTPDKAVPRYTFGFEFLDNGIPLPALALGLFGLAELLSVLVQGTSISRRPMQDPIASLLAGIRDCLSHWKLWIRTSAIGVYIGFLPGLGGSVVDWLAYGHAVQSSADRSRFGHGDIRGVIGPEAANNSVEAGSLIHTLLFGIPGSGSMALFLVGLYVLGISPGKAMVATPQGLTLTYTMGWTLALANAVGMALMLLCIKPIAHLAAIKITYVAPIALAVITIAGFQADPGAWTGDAMILLAFGILGWLMKQWGWPRPPVLIGFILGGLSERYFFVSFVRYGWSWLVFPGVLIIGGVTVLGLVFGLRYLGGVGSDVS